MQSYGRSKVVALDRQCRVVQRQTVRMVFTASLPWFKVRLP